MDTLPHAKATGVNRWYADHKDEPAYKQPSKRSPQSRQRFLEHWRDRYQQESHRRALRQVAWMVVRRKDLMEYTESLAEELNMSLDRLYFIALAGFFERYEENLKAHADDLHTPSSYWEAGECTEEEFNAILEADRLEPELAESGKDLLED